MKLYWELFKVRSIALRYFNVYGTRQPDEGDYALAVGIFLKQYRHKQPFTIYGDGTQRRDFIHISDVVTANIRAMTRATAYDMFDVGYGVNYSINELTDMIDPHHPKTYLPPRVEPSENLANKRKFLPGWKPKMSISKWLSFQ